MQYNYDCRALRRLLYWTCHPVIYIWMLFCDVEAVAIWGLNARIIMVPARSRSMKRDMKRDMTFLDGLKILSLSLRVLTSGFCPP